MPEQTDANRNEYKESGSPSGGGNARADKWSFVGEEGDFTLKHPQFSSFLYFPLVNEAGMMSSITPTLHGDIKTGHNTFLTEPVSAETLHNSRAARNFWIYADGDGAWSCGGSSARQQAARFGGPGSAEADAADETGAEGGEQAVLEAGLLWHKVTREHPSLPLRAETVNFVPAGADRIELMKITLTHTGGAGSAPISLVPTAAIPLYARSADDLRDHRHVTSLLHRIYTAPSGVEVQPTLSFDERGHRMNTATYSVFGAEGNGTLPVGFFPSAESFVGEGGAYDWPEAVASNLPPVCGPGERIDGLEAVGALRFERAELRPGESRSYVLAMLVSDDRPDEAALRREYLTEDNFDRLLAECKDFWRDKVGTVGFRSGDREFDLWMKWVTLQPVLRRLYGNSFMPHHDYGRGGRGWRDLWQDCLALMVMEPDEVRELLLNNFAGVRIDGSNATIIGRLPGEFVADRNNIPRVWMDHGAWPLLTVMLYIHQSGDLDFLLQEQTYFRDAFTHRCKRRDEAWTPEDGSLLKAADGSVYRGSVLEHILLQHLTPFYSAGEHNMMRLEGADWNDGLDMAAERGESVAFTAFYAGNMRTLADVLRKLEKRTESGTIELAEEMLELLDRPGAEGGEAPADGSLYDSIDGKHAILDRYLERVAGGVSGRLATVRLSALAADLERKAEWTERRIREQEWISSESGNGWFNGYYDNDGQPVEGDREGGIHMTLTGQVFPVMSGVATPEQVRSVIEAADRHLLDPGIGYRLNTDFGGIRQNLGRAFGFAFGHKENGAMFSHMTVMYANALYKRGFAREGHAVLDSVYRLSSDFERSRIYPGIPEYINARGRGMYHYLTGSASWMLLTVLMEAYGVRGNFGDLLLAPRLPAGQYGVEGRVSVRTRFADRDLQIVYLNPAGREYDEFSVAACRLNGVEVPYESAGEAGAGCLLKKDVLTALPAGGVHRLEVELA
ncbi:cellobiose phosphorylase [Saccharibacillus sp. CPCC 101409]|uniref:GH36-type glycosyl hydrolase domain-containing protein n=1 Tax=Saccharibacillus sp. CPCC 101409 TaxID=3058041 RepID=UPI0026726DA5|nr:cellobiose phosphorylase [Saccharibacillus sp. CPCC 101409]MDO3411723.1 cellobiose phosphorylase [Saccharibacillus sp. CPCC 101409]